jgi:hypothetical protein
MTVAPASNEGHGYDLQRFGTSEASSDTRPSLPSMNSTSPHQVNEGRQHANDNVNTGAWHHPLLPRSFLESARAT